MARYVSTEPLQLIVASIGRWGQLALSLHLRHGNCLSFSVHGYMFVELKI